MTIMKFNSQICTTKEQSERLMALGLKKGTADMAIISHPHKDIKWQLPITEVGKNTKHTPAWSLHRLLCLLPTEYIADIDFQQVMQDFVFRSQDMYDEVISCIETLIKEGYFYEEFLEE